MKNQDKNPHELAKEFLGHAIELNRTRDGALTAIAEEMTKRCGKPVLRQQVYEWLHIDDDKRRTPGLGNGLMLASVAKRVASKLTTTKRGKMT